MDQCLDRIEREMGGGPTKELERKRKMVEGGAMLELKMMDRKPDQWAGPALPLSVLPILPPQRRRDFRTIPCVSYRSWRIKLKQNQEDPLASLETSNYLQLYASLHVS